MKRKKEILVETKKHYLHQAAEAVHNILPTFPTLVGKNQSRYRSKKGVISLITVPSLYRRGKTDWEIYCLEGDLFEDKELYPTKVKAEERIQELLVA